MTILWERNMPSTYKSKHSTETAILKIHNDILRTMDMGECTIFVRLDLSAAYDTIKDSIIIYYWLALRTLLVWSPNVLPGQLHISMKNTTDTCQWPWTLSDVRVMKLNVPQGSILGPDAYANFTKPVGDIVRANKGESNVVCWWLPALCTFQLIICR